MVAVAKKFRKVQITVRVNPQNLQRLDALGEASTRNRSEMVDRAIEEYVQTRISEVPAAIEKRIRAGHFDSK